MRVVRFLRILLASGVVLSTLDACGGAGGNPLDNPPSITNSGGGSGQTLSFDYFQRCVNPIFDSKIPITLNGVTIDNTCSNAACHNDLTGHGGAFRIVPDAAPVVIADTANTPAVIRTQDIYKNFLSAQGETIVGAPLQSLLINKPLVRNVLHGGGVIFASESDPDIQRFIYWISNPMPAGQDEFGTAGANLFTPANPDTGACNTN